ncbi:hypothetical protein SAMN04487769_1967 [Burkholderia sp. b14]|nr:hypothetical protein SAMN04487769_1967 [Burkholderia sp. b14]
MQNRQRPCRAGAQTMVIKTAPRVKRPHLVRVPCNAWMLPVTPADYAGRMAARLRCLLGIYKKSVRSRLNRAWNVPSMAVTVLLSIHGSRFVSLTRLAIAPQNLALPRLMIDLLESLRCRGQFQAPARKRRAAGRGTDAVIRLRRSVRFPRKHPAESARRRTPSGHACRVPRTPSQTAPTPRSSPSAAR